MLIDFGATKALQSDERLAVLSGSGYSTHFVKKEEGQFPAPEILMDLRFVSLYFLFSNFHFLNLWHFY